MMSLSPTKLSLALNADQFDVPYSGTLMAKLNGLYASVDATIDPTKLAMSIVIERGTYELPSLFSDTSKTLMPLGVPSDIVIVGSNEEILKGRPRKPVPTSQPVSQPASKPTKDPKEVTPNPDDYEFAIDIEIQDQLFIVNPPPEAKGMVSDLKIQLGTNDPLEIRMRGSLFTMDGTIKLIKGSSVSLINNRFTFSEDSALTFVNSDNPELALTATSEITATSDSGPPEVFDVSLIIKGTAYEPLIDWKSAPPLEKGKILQLILTGKLDSPTDTAQQSLLVDGIGATAQALGNSVAQMGIGMLIQNTPLSMLTNKTLDVFGVEVGLLDMLRADLEKVEVGRHVFKRCYIDFFLKIKSEEAAAASEANKYEADFTCRMSGRAGFDMRYGDKTKSADIVWSKDY
jgi:hypothetical protein